MAINKRKIPEINAGSMADIAFLLLIFFLVATTMNTDTGIQRVLPPWVENPTDDAPPIKERNLMAVKVNQYDQIQMQGKLVDLHQVKDLAKEFILNAGNSEDLPEKKMTEIELIGQYPVSEGVISLQNDRGTSYDMYIKVQNELTRAFNVMVRQVNDAMDTLESRREKLEQSNIFRERILENLSNGIIVLDHMKRLRSANMGAVKILGNSVLQIGVLLKEANPTLAELILPMLSENTRAVKQENASLSVDGKKERRRDAYIFRARGERERNIFVARHEKPPEFRS